jgi:sulfonate transport system permease protein
LKPLSYLGRIDLVGGATFLAVLAVWEAAIRLQWVELRFMAAPTEVLAALLGLFSSGDLVSAGGHTLRSVVIGWLLAVVLGVSVGTAIGSSRQAFRYSLATIDFMRSMPSIALVAPAVLIFGFSVEMELVVIVFGSVWPVVINTMGGIERVPRELHEVARVFRLSPLRKAWTIVMPAAAPSILVGARLAMGLALILAVISEMVGNPRGLGFAIIFEQQAIRPAHMFAYVVTIGLLGVVLNEILVRSARAVAVFRTSSERR